MAANIPSFTLNNGIRIPSIGMGCWMGRPGEDEQAYQMCLNAINTGYRHFDTATGYGNERQVGQAMRDSKVPRNELYVTTKLANPHHGRVKEAFEESLKTLNCEYIDLYLMHWPQAAKPDWGKDVFRPDESPTFVETWKDMEKLLEHGKVKSIGVSNFSIKNLEILLAHCSIIPINQVEMHPCLPQNDLKVYCDSKGIILTAYSPLGQPTGPDQAISLFNNNTIKALANKLNADLAQVLLSWGVQRKTIVIPKTGNEMRMKTNITVIELSAEDMEAIDNLHLQPNMHRTLCYYEKTSVEDKIGGWTCEELGWDMVGGIV
ncbi:aldo/keto reductase [Rhodocollybia butyracea]|uniref:Aldo/keto reductase n=1 Tax=Rhodocollybia butyracea TaxID=206335 RepID=A0A9P5QCT4_9AGAR|nr:aldo/keto reductase [Rhodocollybia butyracea]